LKISAYMILRV